jgi:branched-chain amino acid transport system ATP-binding protein
MGRGIMLEVKDLVVSYGRVQAVKGISFSVEQGQVVSLLGTNGAGKTTTLCTISGLNKPVSGEIWFEGERLDGVPAHEVVQRGIAQSPEGRRLFPRLSVEDNLLLGAYTRKDAAGVRSDLDRVYTLFPVLGERKGQAAGLFSGGEQQMVAIGRAMMSRPKLLMLDEPSMGLSPIMTQTIMRTIAELQAEGTTILLVEQNAQAALALADRGYVLEVGSIAFSGTGHDLMNDDRIRKTYLGLED